MLRLAHMQGTTSLLEMTKAPLGLQAEAWAGYDNTCQQSKMSLARYGIWGFPFPAQSEIAEGIMELWQRAGASPNKANISQNTSAWGLQ